MMFCIANYKLEILQSQWKKHLHARKCWSNKYMYLHMNDGQIKISN